MKSLDLPVTVRSLVIVGSFEKNLVIFPVFPSFKSSVGFRFDIFSLDEKFLARLKWFARARPSNDEVFPRKPDKIICFIYRYLRHWKYVDVTRVLAQIDSFRPMYFYQLV